MYRDGGEGGLGDEGEGAFAADHEMGEQVDRAGVVEERVDAVAHGVLDGVQPPDCGHRCGISADAVTEAN